MIGQDIPQAKFKRSDIVDFKNDGQVMKGTAINQDKSPGRVFNYLNGEWDDGVTRTIGGERFKLRELEEVCNMVLILTYRHGDQDSMLWELNWGNWRGLKHTKIC